MPMPDRHRNRLAKLKTPVTAQAFLKARLRFRTSLDPSYFENFFPQNKVREPVSGNTAYKAKLILTYYHGCYEGVE